MCQVAGPAEELPDSRVKRCSPFGIFSSGAVPMKKWICLVCFIISLGIPSLASGAEPLAVLQSAIERGIRILGDPRYRETSERELQERKLWEIVEEVFDFQEFSRQVLGRHWKEFTTQERREFIEVFSTFLRRATIPIAQERYNGQEVVCVDQESMGKSRALVKIAIIWQTLKIPAEVLMLRQNKRWKVYNVIVLGISVAKNYRAQFDGLLAKQSPAQLIAKMKHKTVELGKP